MLNYFKSNALEEDIRINTEMRQKPSIVYAGFDVFIPKDRLWVNLRLTKIVGNKYPYFSITGCTRDGSSGCVHDEILQCLPQFKIFVDLHLNDHMGRPMYPIENSYYFYENKDVPSLAKHLHISEEHASNILEKPFMDKESFTLNYIIPSLSRGKEKAEKVFDIFSNPEKIEILLDGKDANIGLLNPELMQMITSLSIFDSVEACSEFTEMSMIEKHLQKAFKTSNSEVMNPVSFFQEYLPVTYVSMQLQELAPELMKEYLEDLSKDLKLEITWINETDTQNEITFDI